MDHFDIVKRAWRITWKYKVLWILGLFAGAGSGGSFGGSRGYNGGSFGNNAGTGGAAAANPFPRLQDLGQRLQGNLPVLFMIVAGLIMLGIAWWILSVAARGGLAYLGNEAAEGRPVHARNGWGFGFHLWGRTFLIGFVLGLPVLALALIVGIAVALAVAAGMAGGATAASGIVGSCGVIGLAAIVFIPLAIVVGVLYQLALRHGSLDGMTTGAAISAAWWDLRHRFADVAVMWVVLFALGIGYVVVIGVIAVALFLPAIGLALFGAWAPAALLFLVAVLILLLPSAVFGTLISTSWTLFFRHLTGRDALAAAPVHAAPAGYVAPPALGAYAPAPPMPPQMPAPPVPTPPPSQ